MANRGKVHFILVVVALLVATLVPYPFHAAASNRELTTAPMSAPYTVLPQAATGEGPDDNYEGTLGALPVPAPRRPPDDNTGGAPGDSAVLPAPDRPDDNRGPGLPAPDSSPSAFPIPAANVALSASETVLFPATGDTIDVLADPHWWNAGDYAEGSRTVGLDLVSGVAYTLVIAETNLRNAGRVNMDLSLNGITVGSFTVYPGEMTKSVYFGFPPIPGPDYVVRLEETNNVDPNCGSIVLNLDTSSLAFSDSRTSPFFPASGDIMNVQMAPYWWNDGDYAEGVRTPGPDSVSGAAYTLVIAESNLRNTGRVDLDLIINCITVGSFTVFPGETTKSANFGFPPIPGPEYVVRLEETNYVDPDGGSITLDLDASQLRLLNIESRMFLPLVTK